MKTAVVGPGGVGGYFGALLARAGREVVFLGRGEHLRAIRERGITVRSFRGDVHANPRAEDDPARIGPCDLILFCVKSFDTTTAAEQIRPLLGPKTIILSLQNGVDNEEVIGSILGPERVLGGVAFIGSRIEAPGIIRHTAAGHLTFGETRGEISERGEKILEFLLGAGIEARLTDNIGKAAWRKMVWNCGFNAVTALTDTTAGEALACSETRGIVRQAMDETVSVAGALGFDLGRDLPEKTIHHTDKEGEIITSMLMDMRNGRRMEIEALNGAVCRKGERLGIPAPVNILLYGLVSAINLKRT